MNNLVETIREKMDFLSQTEVPYEKERDFFEQFLREYNANNFETYQIVSNAAYFLAVLASSNINMDFEDLVEHIEVVEDFVNYLDFDIFVYSSYLEKVSELNDLGLLEKIINREKLGHVGSKTKKLYNAYMDICKRLFCVNEGERKVYDYKINDAFNRLFLAFPNKTKFESFIDFNMIGERLKSIIEETVIDGYEDAINDSMFDDYDRQLFGTKKFSKFVEKEKSRIVNETLREFITTADVNIFEDYEQMKKHYDRILKEAKEVVKTTNKKIKKLEELMYKLSYINPERLIKVDNGVYEFLFDDKIKYYYLLYSIEHNYNLQKKAEEKNIEFSNNSLNKLEILFSKYGFNFNEFNEEERESIINETNVFHVENILNSIKYSELSFISEYASEFVKIIIFSKPEVIKFIDHLLKNKIIDKKFIFKNIDILCPTRAFERLYNNINYLSSIGVNIVNIFKDDPGILLLDSEELIARTNILSEYNFKLDKEDVYNFDALNDDKMLDLLDNYIELGLKDIILDNPKYLTSNGFDTIKRIMICNLIGVNPINKSNKIVGSVNTGNNFYVAPGKYDNFIIDYKHDYQNHKCVDVLNNNVRNIISQSTKNRMFVKKLDELYMKDELTYVIEGVVISRNRVLRNLDVLIKHLFYSDLDISDMVFQSILYNMINNVEPEVIEKIYNAIRLIEIDFENSKKYTLK